MPRGLQKNRDNLLVAPQKTLTFFATRVHANSAEIREGFSKLSPDSMLGCVWQCILFYGQMGQIEQK